MQILVSVKPIEISLLDVNDLASFPTLGLMWVFWKEGEFGEFLEQNEFVLPSNFTTTTQMHDFAKYAFYKFKEILKNPQKRENFNQDIVTAFANSRDFKDDYELLSFDISALDEALKQKVKEAFKQLKSAAFVDFKMISQDKVEIAYSRSCVGKNFDGSLSVTATKKERVTLKMGAKFARESNPVCTQIVATLAEVLPPEVSFASFYAAKDGAAQELKSSSQEIILAAKEAVKRQNAANRGSLREGSNEERALNEMSRVRLSQETQEEAKESLPKAKEGKLGGETEQHKEQNLSNSNLTNSQTQEGELGEQSRANALLSFEKFADLEREKLNIKLTSASQKGEAAYADLCENLAQGVSLNESFEYIKQKYRNEYTTAFADLFLCAKIASLRQNEALAQELQTQLDEMRLQAQREQARLNEAIAKKEASVKEFQAAVANKSNELLRFKEFHTNELNRVAEETKEEIRQINEGFEGKIAQFEQLFKEQGELIERMEAQIKLFEADLAAERARARELDRKNAVLEDKLASR